MIAALRWAASGVALLLLAGCATRAPLAALPPPLSDPAAIHAAEQEMAQRTAWLQQHPQWSFEGRVAINNAGTGGNGRIDWQQDGQRYVVSLIAPVTRQSWRLIGDTHSEAGRLEGLEGGTLESDDAEALLRQATGWEIPVHALAQWVRGLPAEDVKAASRSFSADGRLQQVEQGGWRIDYPLWFDAQETQPALPRRIEAQRDQATVRLIVDRWEFPAQ